MASIIRREWTTKSGEVRIAWRVKYHVRGKQRWKQCTTERKARRFAETLATVKARELAAPSAQGPRISELARRFLAACSAGRNGAPALEPETVVFYRGHLEHHILPVLGDTRIGSLTAEMVREFRQGLLEGSVAGDKGRGKASRRRGSIAPTSLSPTAPRLSAFPPSEASADSVPASLPRWSEAAFSATPAPSPAPPSSRTPTGRTSSPQGRRRRRSSSLSRTTARKVLTTLKTLVGYALEEGEIQHDPTHRVTIRMSSRERNRVEIHSKEEMRSLLDTAATLCRVNNRQVARTWSRYYPLVLTLVYTGIRISEARGLRRRDVDLAAGVIEIHFRADKRGRMGVPKSAAGTRRIHIPDALASVLEAWMQTHDHDLVFPTRTGEPLNTDNVRKFCWNELQRRAGVRRLTLHSARHFFASREIEAGVGLKELCSVMGHADEAFTLKTYGHLFRDPDSERKRAASAEARVL